MKTLSVLNELLIYWAPTNAAPDAASLEMQLQDEFVELRHGNTTEKLPWANQSWESVKTSKPHGIEHPFGKSKQPGGEPEETT